MPGIGRLPVFAVNFHTHTDFRRVPSRLVGQDSRKTSLSVHGLLDIRIMSDGEESSPTGFGRFLALAFVWFVSAYLAGHLMANLPFGFVVLAVFLFAVPIAMSGAYSSAVEQARAVSYYRPSGWAYKLFSRRFLRSFLWVIWALGSSFLALLQFLTYSGLQWATLCLVIPVFWIFYTKSYRLISTELKKRYVITSIAILGFTS